LAKALKEMDFIFYHPDKAGGNSGANPNANQ